MRSQLLYYALKYKGDYHKIKKAIEQEETWEKVICEEQYITILDDIYPSVLKNLKYPPWVLFYKGNLQLLKERMIAVIGSRDYSEYGKFCTRNLLQYMKKEYGVISGVAKGIDGFAHAYAMQYHRFSIGVLGCGLNVIYPKENEKLFKEMEKHQLLISEYPADTKPLAYHFPWRNRIIAALCERLVVVEARVKSGTMITVSEALELNIPVYAFSHNINNKNGEGCNLLIEQGCNMIKNIQDIKEL